MSDKNDIESVAKVVLEVQGTALACQLMLKALLVRIVVNDPNSEVVLRKLFEHVSADLDRGQEALAGSHKTSISYARRILEETFSSLDRALANRASGRTPGSDPT